MPQKSFLHCKPHGICSLSKCLSRFQITEEEYKKLWNHEVQAEFPPGEAPEISEVQSAPMWPKRIQEQYDRFQWVYYLLRKAYMQPSPDSAAQHLIDAGSASYNTSLSSKVAVVFCSLILFLQVLTTMTMISAMGGCIKHTKPHQKT